MSAASDKPTSFDAGRQQVGRVYAQALLGAADKAGAAAAVVDELDSLLRDVMERLPDLAATLASSRVAHEDKCRLLDTAFAGRTSELLLDFLKVVSQHERLDSLREISQQARRLYNESRGRVEVNVATAGTVDGQLLRQIGNALRGALASEIDLTTSVDPELIGGIVVRVGDTVYDSSVAGGMKRLRRQALDQSAHQFRGTLDRFLSE